MTQFFTEMDESPLEARHTKAKDNKGVEGKGKSRAAGNNQLRKSPIDSFFDRDGEEAGNAGVCMHTRRVKYASSVEGAEEKHSNSVLVCRRPGRRSSSQKMHFCQN